MSRRPRAIARAQRTERTALMVASATAALVLGAVLSFASNAGAQDSGAAEAHDEAGSQALQDAVQTEAGAAVEPEPTPEGTSEATANSPADAQQAIEPDMPVIEPDMMVSPQISRANAHSFTFPGLDGGVVRLADYAGKALLVVNTASFCGFTGQFDGLQELADTYQEAGLVVLGVPSHSFGQEEATGSEAKDYCEVNFGITFPMTDIVQVQNHPNNDYPDMPTHAFFDWVRAETGDADFPTWNFNKALIGPQGDLVATFKSIDTPMGRKVRRAIDETLEGGI